MTERESETESETEGETEAEPEPSDGLEFTSNGDGTCYVIGIGMCTDTSIIIPITSPDGDSAFSSCSSLTSVTMAYGVKSIGYRAFYNCTSFTTVNYIGSEKQWKKISIALHNSPLKSATINYNYVPEEE